MKNIKLFLEGFIIGIGKIIPGVSGSVMAISFGVYETIVASLSSLKELKQNKRIMLVLGIGIFLAIILGSNIIKVLLENYYLNSIMFFIGMVIPGMFPILKEIRSSDLTFKRVLICVGFFAMLVILNNIGFSNSSNLNESMFHQSISLMLCGVIDAASTIIPGISGTAILMILGYYEKIITALADVASSNFLYSLVILIPFFIGMGIGVVLTSKMITYLFKKARGFTHMIILCFSSFSVVALFMNVFNEISSLQEFLASFLYLIFGFIATILMNKLFTSN